MGEEILQTNIEREEGYLYYTKGNPLIVCKAKMKRGGKKKNDSEIIEKAKKKSIFSTILGKKKFRKEI